MLERLEKLKAPGLIAFIAAWLCVSAYTTVSLCLTFHNAAASVAIGVLWTISKIVIVEHFRRRWIDEAVTVGSLLVLALSGALILGDIAGTIGYFAAEDQAQETKLVSSTPEHSIYISQLDSIRKQIETAQRRSDRYEELGLLTRSSKEQKNLSSLMREQNDLIGKINNIEVKDPKSTALSVLGFKHKRETVFLFIAIVVEACPAVGLAMLRGTNGSRSKRKDDNDDDYPGQIREATKAAQVIDFKKSSRSSRDVAELVSAAESLIRSGVEPSYVSLRKSLRIGQDAVVEVVRQLREHGVIRRHGKGHTVA